jgi:hypothetical protein
MWKDIGLSILFVLALLAAFLTFVAVVVGIRTVLTTPPVCPTVQQDIIPQVSKSRFKHI